MAGLAQPASSLLSPVDTFYRWAVPPDQLRTYDPEKAKALLDEAGYVVGDDGIREDAQGNKLEFRLAAFNEYPMDITTAKKITSSLEDVTIGTDLQVMDENAFYDLNYDNADNDLYIWSWTAEIDPGLHPEHVHHRASLNGSDSEYSNPQYDALYIEQSEAVDPAERQQWCRRCSRSSTPTPRTRSSGTTCCPASYRHVDRVQPRAEGRGRRRVPQHAARHLRNLEPVVASRARRVRRQQHRPHRRHRGRGRRGDRRVARAPDAAQAPERRGVTR